MTDRTELDSEALCGAQIGPFRDALAGRLADDFDRTSRAPHDFADVLRRAESLRERDSGGSVRADAAGHDHDALAPVEQRQPSQLPAELAPFVAAAQSELQAQLDAGARRLVARGWVESTGWRRWIRRVVPRPHALAVPSSMKMKPQAAENGASSSGVGSERGTHWTRVGSSWGVPVAIAAACVLAWMSLGGPTLVGHGDETTRASLAASEADTKGRAQRAFVRNGRGQRGLNPAQQGRAEVQLELGLDATRVQVQGFAELEHGALSELLDAEQPAVEAERSAPLAGDWHSSEGAGRATVIGGSAAKIAHHEGPQPASAKGAAGVDGSSRRGRDSSSAGSKSSSRRMRASNAMLARWESEAREAWRSGRWARAQQLYERIIASGGRRAIVQRAYADLFAVVRSRKGKSAQRSLWTRYLRKFPSGEWAEDARAGLCGGRSGQGARDCWRRYIRHHPNGTHSARAHALLDG